jgi:MFS transporter, ACS family, tartrate transporter
MSNLQNPNRDTLPVSQEMPAAAATATTAAAAHQFERTRHHIALRLLPFLFVLYISNYIDRTNIAYAAIGIARDLHFSDRVFGLAAGIFFVSYVAGQVPGALLVERWSARRMISATLIAWGLLTALTAFVRTPAELYAARFALGAAEAGFFPGVVVYLSHWFIVEDRAKATSNFMAAIPLSFVIGSPIAGLILGHRWLAIEGWRWLFVLEGLPAVVLGAIAFFYLTDLPRDASWLGAHERERIAGTLREERPRGAQAMPIKQALKSRRVVLLTSFCFFTYFAFYSMIFWLPSMLKRQSRLSDASVGVLGALPYAALFAAMLFNGWHSDRSRERYWHAATPVLIATVGFAGLLAEPRSVPVLVLLLSMVTLGSAYLPAFWAIPTEILSESAAAASVGMINAIGSIAGFAGPYLFGYVNAKLGSFRYGLAAMIVSCVAAAALIVRAGRSSD